MNRRKHIAWQIAGIGMTLVMGACLTANHVTPLHEAVRDGDYGGAEAELAGGASPNARDEEGRTPLHYACANGDDVLAELLLSEGADPNARDDAGESPLHYAAANCYGSIVGLLLAAAADVALVNGDGRTALDLANETGCTDVTDLLSSSTPSP